jgi:predicted SprT family Zn-dependent metalloprotease
MIESNANSVLEHHAIAIIEKHLVRLRYPSSRLPLTVVFDYSMKEFATHKIVLEPNQSYLAGMVTLKLNGLFLHQSPANFYVDSIPHELAHIFHELEYERKGIKIHKPHDMEWQKWLHKINSEAEGTVAGSPLFNPEAAKLMSGAIPCSCECPGAAGFKTFPNTSKSIARIRDGEEVCPDCERSYRTIKISEIPDSIEKELDFIRGKICIQAEF